ncbi:hypothetical protein YQE_05471, partial [Dendroctonus ponderosae]
MAYAGNKMAKQNAQPADAGNLTCTVSNEGGTLIQSYHLNGWCSVTPFPQIRVNVPANLAVIKSAVFCRLLALYQCVAVNEVGRVWTAAQLVINNSQSPSPPQNIQCRPYDDDKICLTWNKPENVSVKAYSVYSSYLCKEICVKSFFPSTPHSSARSGRTWTRLAHGLKHSTNYTFYVRLYSNHASDHSEKVTCQTGKFSSRQTLSNSPEPMGTFGFFPGFKGSRNLDIEMSSITAVKLSWDKLSSDFLCNGTTDSYVVQWFRDGDPTHLSTGLTLETDFIVSGLVSTFLTNLSTDDTYFVMVRAANDVGIGQPCPPIIVRTFHMSKNPNGMLNGSDVAGKQRLGKLLPAQRALMANDVLRAFRNHSRNFNGGSMHSVLCVVHFIEEAMLEEASEYASPLGHVQQLSSGCCPLQIATRHRSSQVSPIVACLLQWVSVSTQLLP